jgi:hypothetical protein
VQVFIPAKGATWQGLPQIHAAQPRRSGLQNKPADAFWTSTFTEHEGAPASDWDQWMRSESPKWHPGHAVVLEVSPDARVKHIRTEEEARDFVRQYRMSDRGLRSWSTPMDWAQIMDEYDALHVEADAITYDSGFYGWDAESTAWFNTDHLTEIGTVKMPEVVDWWRDVERDNPRRKRKRTKDGRLTGGERSKLFRKLMRI